MKRKTDPVDQSRPVRWFQSRETRRFLVLRLLPLLAVLNLAWEIAQLPLYTLWKEGSARGIAFAVLHCTIGDVLIGAATLAIALTVLRAGPLGTWRVTLVAAVMTVLAVSYTVLSEWVNVELRRSWAYSELMPGLPVTGTGVSPLLQWLVIPGVAFALALNVRGGAATRAQERP